VNPSSLFTGLHSHALLLTDLPFYERYPKLAETALGITGFALLAPVAVVGTLIAVGFASAGVAAGNSISSNSKRTDVDV